MQNLEYKTADHQFRSRDEYANAKYDITSTWLAPFLAAGRLTVANVGCGGGEYNHRLAAFEVNVVACEPEPKAFALAYESAKTSDRIRVENYGLEKFAEEHGPFDVLVMHDVLEHIEDEAYAVDCVAKLIRPGGQAVISVPAYQWLFGYHDVQLGHYRRYTRTRLMDLFKPSFEILNARYYGSLFIPVTLIFSKWMQKPYPIGEVTANKWKQRVFRTACQFQRLLPEPIGTSVLIHLQKR